MAVDPTKRYSLNVWPHGSRVYLPVTLHTLHNSPQRAALQIVSVSSLGDPKPRHVFKLPTHLGAIPKFYLS